MAQPTRTAPTSQPPPVAKHKPPAAPPAAPTTPAANSPVGGKTMRPIPTAEQTEPLIPMPADPTELGMTAREPEVNKLFRLVMKMEASDLHLKVGQPPMMRLRGDIRKTDMKPLSQEDMERLLLPNLKPSHRKILEEEGGVDFSYVIGHDEARFRVSLFKQRGRLSLVSRRVNSLIPTFENLGLPASIEGLCHYNEGMVILAGVTGSGKSTTIAAVLDSGYYGEPLHI